MHGLRIIRLAIERFLGVFFVTSAIFVYCNGGGACESAGVSGQEIFFLSFVERKASQVAWFCFSAALPDESRGCIVPK